MSKVILRNVRISFPKIWRDNCDVDDSGKKRYTATFIYDRDGENHKTMQNAVEAAAAAKWGAKGPAILKSVSAANKVCIKNGDAKAQYEGFEGNIYTAASNRVPPALRDRDNTKLEDDNGRIYAGCYVNVVLDVYGHEHPKSGKQVNAQLMGVQFVDDGDSFGGGGKTASDDDFDDLSTGDENPYV